MTQRIVINTCFGGFSLSREAVKRLAELQGRPCYFFELDFKTGTYQSPPDVNGMMWTAFDIPNPNEVLINTSNWSSIPMEERKRANELYEAHRIDQKSDDRSNPLLIKVVDELGERANGACAQLNIVEIPDGIEWEIDNYDGNESINEKHRSWR